MRLPGPQLYPGYGKGALEMADLLIASGTSIDFYKDRLNRELVDVPNGVDVEKFYPGYGIRDPGYGIRDAGYGTRDTGCEIGDEKAQDQETYPESRISNPESRVLHVIYVARLTKIKNHGLLLRAVAGVKKKGIEVRVTLVGSGPLRGDIEGLVKELGLEQQVELRGEVPYEQLPDLYRAADVAVVASDYESFGFVVLEAMACGVPVVASDVGGNGEVVADVSLGTIYPFGDDEALFGHLDDALAREWSREALLVYTAANNWDLRVTQLLASFDRAACPMGTDKPRMPASTARNIDKRIDPCSSP
jgi:glycosyltransferase involved in cell wall biosynthesis